MMILQILTGWFLTAVLLAAAVLLLTALARDAAEDERDIEERLCDLCEGRGREPCWTGSERETKA